MKRLAGPTVNITRRRVATSAAADLKTWPAKSEVHTAEAGWARSWFGPPLITQQPAIAWRQAAVLLRLHCTAVAQPIAILHTAVHCIIRPP